MNGILPAYPEIVAILASLMQGTISRAQASEWATPFVIGPYRIQEQLRKDLLNLICMADLTALDRPYLYNNTDFQSALERIQSVLLAADHPTTPGSTC